MLGNLINKTFSKVYQIEDEIHFEFADKTGYKLYHQQDCCERVYIESVTGDLSDLENTPILWATENTSTIHDVESGTWTFYKFATIKGYVDIRFNGESNGYYSESVEIGEL
jgi:hypothetical protein